MTDRIKFKYGNIGRDAKHIPNRNTVLMCRNLWGYLEPRTRIQTIAQLAKRFDHTCLIAIGDYDREFDIDAILEDYGFVEVMENVYQKPRPKIESENEHKENIFEKFIKLMTT